ncbi:hypothetical protein, partial [Streptomyces brasiliscabiei]|uniref:hypothetical protein n=1 Tax=Streptomyces brasiliscabiei TaxID=2736302 RepID=UPI001C1136CE
YAGDVQARQANVFVGSSDECEADVTLACWVIKGKVPPFVRIDSPTLLIQLASQRPGEDAVSQAPLWLLDGLVEAFGVAPRKAVPPCHGNPAVPVRVDCTAVGAETTGCG